MSVAHATRGSGALTAAELRVAGLDPVALERWRELAEAAADPNPFFEPDFVVPASELLPAGPDRLLVVADSRRWLGCIPLARARVRHLTRVAAAGEVDYGFLDTPLLAADAPPQAGDLLVNAIADRAGAPLTFQRLATTGPFYEALERGVERGTLCEVEREDFERALLRRGDDDPTAHLGSHHRRELRRMGRRLAEELGGQLACEDRAGDPRAIESFLEIERAGWKGREGTAMASDERSAEFMRRVCAGFHARGRLEVLTLGAAGRHAAVKVNLLAPGCSFAFKIAFDERCASYSPGIQLEVENAVRFAAGDLDWMDSCAIPGNSMINRLWRHRRRLCTGVYASPRMRAARASLGLTRGLRTAKRRALARRQRG